MWAVSMSMLWLRLGHVAAASLIDVSARVLDADGLDSRVGRAEMRIGSQFGTVCGMNFGAADVVCRSLGYDHGTVGSSGCRNYGGQNLCGPAQSHIAVKALHCSGGELAISECSWEDPDNACMDHTLDTVIYCGDQEPMSTREGALRLLAPDGSPTTNGHGRLEVFLEGSWAPICSEGFSEVAMAVACRQMGFEGAGSGHAASSCKNAVDGPKCGTVPPHMSELNCGGHETRITSCPHLRGNDVFCACEESVVATCVGNGNTLGLPSSITPLAPF